MIRRGCRQLALVGLVLAWSFSPVQGQQVLVKMGTAAPEGSPWHDVLVQMGQEWERISGGQVKLHIYPGGVLGDELDMVKKMRIGQLHAVAMSGVGLSHLEPGVSCLQIPMMFDSYEELDYVRDRITPRLEQSMERKGFIVLNWGDAGWIHFFGKTPISKPGDIRSLKLFISAGDAETLELYKAAGLRPVPLALTDMHAALQTGMIDAFDVPPLLALINQWFGLATYMVDVKWAPLVGATVVSKRTWDRVPAELRPKLLEAARTAGEKFRADIRTMSEEAVAAMEKRGLKVTRVNTGTLALWKTEAESIYPRLRGPIIPPDLFDEVRRLRDEFRARGAGGA